MEEIKQNESTLNRPDGERILDAPLVLIDLPEFARQLKEEKAWQTNDRNAITVFKTDQLRMVLVAMHPHTEMTTMKPENLLAVQVMEGQLRLNTEEGATEIRAGQAAVLHGRIPYTITALDESLFLLTVSGEEDEAGG